MKQVRTSKKREQRAVIKFLNVEGVCSNKIYERLSNAYGEGAVMSQQCSQVDPTVQCEKNRNTQRRTFGPPTVFGE